MLQRGPAQSLLGHQPVQNVFETAARGHLFHPYAELLVKQKQALGEPETCKPTTFIEGMLALQCIQVPLCHLQ